MYRQPPNLRLGRVLALAPGLVLSATLVAQNPQYALLGNGCAGSMAISQLSLVTPPTIGSTMQVDVTNLPVNTALLLTGFNRTSSPFGPLPLALGRHGMPGCVAYVSPDVTVLVSGAGNLASFALGIPPASGLVGVQFFQQALVPDPGAGNAARVVISDAAAAVIGLTGWPTGGTPIPNMMPIAAGTFMMGSAAVGGVAVPVHPVTITRPFWMGKFEVTQAEYQAAMNTNPSHFQGAFWPNSASRPVETVTWNDAMAYCAALTALERAAGRLPAGYQYRLPTEAEWEYCCRAGTTTEWNTGISLTSSQANFGNPSNGQTAVVGSYAANAWGLHDMHGNVWEWCLDWWDGSANYPVGPVSDPYVTSGPARVDRGGSWNSPSSSHCRSANRYSFNPTYRGWGNGVRVVLAP